ncbi:hypothetical protein F886_00072 [Acinetobacter sp. NIPH 542]|uniref:hypothetical protein n=1 Tax=Acinetobacter sp. NIPH 542 TaxID=1217688 RepID=UPI0002CFC99D|nr:hypothetical protein [Acinetobacter sp. NIPH 542]ENX48271.1 hypothetical protein F886_00072 [Acinetobacter sp. NIPH 542]
MKPTQFIKDHGLEKAREVVEGAPEFVTHVRQTNFGNFIYYKIENGELLVWIPVVDVWSTSTNQDYEVTSLSVLKRLVESVDRVNQRGYSKTKDHLVYLISYGSEFGHVSKTEVSELTADLKNYESIYGEGNEK